MKKQVKDSIIADLEKISNATKVNRYEQLFNELYTKYRVLDKTLIEIIPQKSLYFCEKDYDYQEPLSKIKTILETYLLCDSIPANVSEPNIDISEKHSSEEKLIFLSHKSDDKKFGDALRDFIIGLGVKNNQLIYTSHPMNKIPMDRYIYQYLRENIHSEIFMIILWSNQYLESPACLNEMGAAWVTQADYTNIYVPAFSFGNPKYHQCAVDTNKMGAVLNGDEHCKASMLELKNKIVSMFNIDIEEKEVMFLLDNFISKIKEINENGQT